MTCWTSCSSRLAAVALLAALGACAGPRPRRTAFAGEDGRARVALLPLHNLGSVRAPEREILHAVESSLARAGLEVVSGSDVDEFLARHRLRYTGGIDGPSAVAARAELGVDGVVVTSLVAYAEGQPPRVALAMRLVSADADPRILWIDAISLAGDESPGLFGLGVTKDVRKLEREALSRMTRSLVRFLDARGEGGNPACEGGGAFKPRVAFRSPMLREARDFSVAVLPFVDRTSRGNAGEAVALEFVRHLSSVEGIRVLEPGVVRQVVLATRIIQEGGIALEHARLLTEILDADLVLAGTVRDYDERGPTVDFTALAIHRRGRQIVWESTSRNRGDDTVTLFGAGRIGTPGALLCRMVRTVVDGMLGPRRRGSSRAVHAEESAPISGAAQPLCDSIAWAQLLRSEVPATHENSSNAEHFAL